MITESPRPPDQAAESRVARRGRARAAWVTGLILLAGLVFVVVHFAEGRRVAEMLRRAQPEWLLGAALLQAATYLCAAAVWQRALAAHGLPRSLVSLVPLGFAKLFMDQAVPSGGLSGSILVIRGLSRRAVAPAVGAAVFLIGLVSFYLAFGVAVAVSLALLWVVGGLSGLVLWLASGFLAVAVAVPLSVLWMRAHGTRRLPVWLRRAGPVAAVLDVLRDAPLSGLREPKLLLETTVLQLGVFVLDAATLHVGLLALGSGAPPGAVFASFVTASVVATLTLLPGGIGTFDTTCVGMLHVAGVPIEAALAATLLFRGLSLFLPLLPGLWLARREV